MRFDGMGSMGEVLETLSRMLLDQEKRGLGNEYRCGTNTALVRRVEVNGAFTNTYEASFKLHPDTPIDILKEVLSRFGLEHRLLKAAPAESFARFYLVVTLP